MLLLPLLFLLGSNMSAQTVDIGTGTSTFATSNTYTGDITPFGNRWPTFHMQLLYRASELQAAGVAGTINSIAFNVTQIGSAATNPNYTIKIGTTALSALTTTFQATGAYTTVRPASTYTHALGWNTITFSTPYVWDGVSNIIIDFAYSGADSSYNADTFYTPTTGTNTVTAQHSASTISASVNRPNIRINYSAAVACSGTPAPGNTVASATSVCSGGTVNFSLQNNTTGSGVSYQWFNSAGAIAGANTSAYSAAITSPSSYYCNVTCSGVTTSSNPVAISINPFYNCYNSNYASSTADEEISNVTIGSLTNASTCASVSAGAGSILNRYNNYQGIAATPTVTQGDLVPFSLTQTSCGGSYGNGFQVYIDFNHNGTFEDAERVYNQPAAATGNHTETGTFSIPISALTGVTGMRVTVTETTFPTSTNYANTAYTWGETEDYLINILAAPTCAGIPNAGTASISQASGCAGGVVNLSATGLSGGLLGISYKWQSSPDNSAWTDIPTATNTTFTVPASTPGTTYYRLLTTCSYSSSSNFTNSVSFNGLACGSVNLPASGNTSVECGTSTFIYDSGGPGGDYAVNTGTGYIVLENSGTGVITLTGNVLGMESCCDDIFIYSGTGTGGTQLANYTAAGAITPIVSAPGQPITIAFFSDVSVVGPGFAFQALYSGTCLTCTTAVGGTATAATATFCNSGSTTISATDYAAGTGTRYQWQSSTDNFATAGVPIGSVSTSYSNLSTGSLTSTTSYRLAVFCVSNPSDIAYSTVATVTINFPGTFNPVVGDAICPGESATLVATASLPATFGWTATGGYTNSGSSITVNPTTTTVYTVTATFENNCTASTTTTVIVAPGVIMNSVTSSVASLCGTGSATLTADASVGSSASTYCSLAATSTSFEKIANVTLGSIANASSATAGYEDFTSISTNLAAGVAVPFSIDISSAYANDDRLFINIDLDQNGSFSDAGELLFSGAISTFCSGCSGAAATVTGTVTVPVTALSGITRMRIQLQDYASNTPQVSCGGYTFGQVEDYNVNITGGSILLTYSWTESAGGVTLNNTTTASTSASNISTDKVYTVVATSNFGCIATGNVSVDVDPLPTVTLATTVPICKGTSTTIFIPEIGNAYSWSPSTGLDTTSGATVIANPTSTTTYTVLITNNSTGCQNTQQVVVSVSDPGMITSQPTNAITSTGFGASFSVAGTVGVTYGYQWQRRTATTPAPDGTWVNLSDDYVAPSTGNYTGVNTATLNVFRAGSAPAINNTVYRCILTPPSPCAALVSNNATLTVGNTGITTNPQNLSLCLPAPVSPLPQFTVVTNGSAPTTLVWSVSTNGGANYTAMPMYNIGTGVYAGPNTTAVPGLTFGLLETSPGVYDYKTLTVSGISASTPNNLRFRTTINTFVVSQPAILNISSPLVIDTNLSATAVKVCYTPSASPTTFSIATSGSVGSVVWKYATSAGGTYTDVALGTPAGVSYSASAVGNNYSLTVTTTAGATPVGTYYYKAFVNSAGACASVASIAGAIEVVRPTVSVAQSAAAYCNPGGSAVTLTASGASTYAWTSNPVGYSNSGAVVSVTPAASTVYTVTGTDGFGCTNTASATVNTGNSFTLAATSSLTTVCQGSAVNLTATPTALAGGGTANISFGTNLQSSGTGAATFPVTVSGIPAGSIITSAQLQFTNVNAINGSYRSEIRVALSGAHTLGATQISTLGSGGLISPNPVINLPTFTATSGTINLLLTETYDDGGSTTIDASFGEVKLVIAYSQPATYTYAWSSTPAGFTASGASTSATPAASTSYSVLATSNLGCTASATTSLVTVIPTPVVTGTNDGQPSATRCGFGKVNLTATGSAGSFLTWYAAATGGSPLYTGTTYQTPDLNTSTPYWVEATTYTPGASTYCAPAGGSSSTSYYLNNITTTGGTSNLAYTAGSYTAYINNSATSFSQNPGGAVNVSMGMSGGSTYEWFCWVDWNGDGDFDDSGETIFATTSYTSSPYAGVINVPAGQAAGKYRVRFSGGFIGGITPCGGAPYGNYVDYSLAVGATCASPTRTLVNAVVTPAPALALSSAASTICVGQSTPTVNITAATVGNYNSYSWLPAGSVAGSAAAGYVFTPAATTVYTLTASDAGGCINTTTHTVTVNPNPGIPVLSSNSPICQGSALNLTSTVVSNSVANLLSSNFDSGNTFPLNGWTVLNGTTNNWFVGTAAGSQSGANAAYVGTNNVATLNANVNFFYRDVVIPAGLSDISLKFYLKMVIIDNTFDYIKVYTTTTANTPVVGTLPSTGYSEVFSYTTPALANFTLQTVSLPNALAGTTVRLVFAYKSDAANPLSAPAIDSITLTGAPAPTYAWTGPNAFTSSVQNPSIAGATPAASGTYNLEVTNSFGCKSNASTSATVYPTPTVVAPSNQLYYNGLATAPISLSGTPSGVTFDISGGAAVGLANANGITTIPSFIPVTGSATVSITPKANGCTGATVTYNIVVSAVSANPIANQTYCEGMTTSAIPLSWTPTSLTGVTFNMNVVGDNIGLASATGLTEIPSFVTQPGTATITVYPVYGGVFGGAVSATITVNPLPTATISGSTAVCRNDSAPLITFTGATGTAPYTFTYKLNGGANQTIVSLGNVATIAQPTGSAGSFTYTLVSVKDSSSTTCLNPQSGSATIIVHPTPTVAAVANQSYYSGFATAPITLTGTPSGVTFNISGGAAAGLADVNGVTTIPSFIPTTTPATVTVTPVANGCVGIPVTYQIAFNPVVVNITSNVCGTINNGLNNQINCSSVSVFGYTVTGYQFEITNTDTGVVSIVQSSQHHFKLTDADNYAYGTTFTVRVAAILNGNVQGYFGSTCSITTASVATTKVVTAQCGATLVFVNSTINANSVSSTNLYRFRIALATAPTTYYYIERTVPNFKLTDVVGLPIVYNAEYLVDVQIRVKLAGFEAWSQYGQRCSIFTPAAPETSLVAAQCEDYQVPSNTSLINAIPFPGATAYRFRLTGYDGNGDVNYVQTVDSPTSSFTLSMFTGLTPSTTYTVSVAMELFGSFTAYAKDCTIITPAAGKQVQPDAIVAPFKATAYPNPFANNFMIDVKTSSTSVIAIKVYDMVGRLVEQRTIAVAELENSTIGDRYPSGVYNVVVTQNESVQTVRVVKR